jgi:hypothetical protein
MRGTRRVVGPGLAVLAGVALAWGGAQTMSPGPPDACVITQNALAASLPLTTPNEAPFVRIQERVLALGCARLCWCQCVAWRCGCAACAASDPRRERLGYVRKQAGSEDDVWRGVTN